MIDRKFNLCYDAGVEEKPFEIIGMDGTVLTKGRRSGGPNLLLAGAFGIPMPAEEQAMWKSLSDEQKAVAILRLRVLLDADGLKPPTPEQAAAYTGLSLNRWYEMFAAWREKRSLSRIGISADLPRSRKMEYHDVMQRLVVGVVDADPKGSVRRLALALGDAYTRETGISEDDRPSYITIRKFVEAELRRRAKAESPGHHVVFDCCACELPHANGAYVAFLVIDKGSRLVLGAALGDADESHAGYALAAKDALDRIRRDPLDRLGWAEDLTQSEIVIGRDTGSWAEHAADMIAAGMREHLQPSTKARRFGAYVRPLIGLRMGRVKFTPGTTFTAPSFAKPSADDVTRFAVEVDVHNADLVPGVDQAAGRQPPATLVALLKRLAKG